MSCTRHGRAATLALLPMVAVLGGVGHAADRSAVDAWGGSVALTSDYFVRGVSRSDDDPALQLDLHYSSASGFIAGALASNTQIYPRQPKDLELAPFLGYSWNMSSDWRDRALITHYAYLGNRAGSNYDYDELDVDLAYRGWLHAGFAYSPNLPRFLPPPYGGFLRVTQKSAEISLQRQLVGKLSATAGVGYSALSGRESGGYAYGSAGAAYDVRSVSLAVSYVNTTTQAKALFYNAASPGRWTATVIWRF